MITRHLIKDREITEFVMEGPTTVAEMVDIIKSQYPTVTKLLLWNLSAWDVSSFTEDDMWRIAGAAKIHSVHEKTAFLGESPFVFGMLQMYTSHSEMAGVPLKMEVFRDRDEAIEWLED